ncbi:nicotinate-nucleotide--dimethylbenzimidazole phosphoribosyltransferase [Kitasatospora sp. NPDC056273]|uniref:nicotinate-nucleotide--dimethylbenzimidazole phosphoribosyltransferase n=1 Tax=Kitasatospora sp. NPDC056273 TaxID=3345769 RepID=UPI0035E0BC86
MTDGGHVPGEGMPEHLHGGPGPLGGPEGVAGVAPLQGVATDGGAIPNPAAPIGGVPGAVPPGAGGIPPQGQYGYGVPGVPQPGQPGEGWGVDQGAPRPAFHFLDQPDTPDGLDDEDDVLLMPGPQGSWGEPLAAVPAEQVPLAPQHDGTPVEPSWPPVDPPVLGAEHGVQQHPVQQPQQPMTQAQQPRRPLHAGPPIPDPSLMTGQVPVRSLADRGPSQGGTPAHGIPVVGRPPMAEAAAPAVAPQAVPAAPAAPVVEGQQLPQAQDFPQAQQVQQAPQAHGAQQVPLGVPPVETVLAVETVGAIEVIEVVETPEAAQAVPAQPVQDVTAPQALQAAEVVETAVAAAPQAPVAEPAPAEAAQPVAEAADAPVAEPVAAETAVAPAAPEAVAAEGAAADGAAVPAEQPEAAAPAGQPRRISAFLAAPTPHGLPKVGAAGQAPVVEETAAQQPAPIAAADAPQAVEVVEVVEAAHVAEAVAGAESAPVAEAAEVAEAAQQAEVPAEAVSEAVAEPVAETAAGTGEMPSGQAVTEPAAEGEQPQQQAEVPAEAVAEPVAEQPVEAPAEADAAAAVEPAAEAPVEAAPEAEAAQPAEAVEEPAAEAAEVAAPAEAVAEQPLAAAPEAEAPAEPAAEQAQAPAEPEAAAEQPVAVEEPAAEAEPVQEQAAEAPAEAAEQPQAEQPAAGTVESGEVTEVAEAGEATEPAEAAEATEEQPVAKEQPAAEAAEEQPEPQPEEPAEPRGPAAPGYDEAGREAVHQVIRERRDVRNGFRPDPIPHEVLIRVLEAAHTAPSVGYSQPWDFVVIRSAKTRRRMHALAERQREAFADSLPKGRAKQFKEIKIEAILDTPVNIVVTADRTRGGRHTLGRHTQPQMAPYSAALAVENLWLAARAEGLGVGWVSFFDDEELVRELGLPEHLEVVAYLCVGFVDEFPDEPELEQQGWAKKRPLSWVVHEEQYGNRALPGEEPQSLLADTLRGIRPLDAKALGEAWDRQKRMTKPAGSLGMLEIISAQLCGLSRKCPPPLPEPACVAIFAGDHGVHAQGVSPWPQEVTAQMVGNFLAGGAVINSFAKQIGTEVCVVDVGVAAELPDAVQQGRATGLLPRKVRPGTADMTQGPAMTREEALKAIEVGIETARDLVAAGNKALVTGDMGIANTTASAALISVFTGLDPAEVTGRGTGIDDETHARKVEVIRAALALHQPDPSDPIGVLAAVGGLEHAALAGFLLGAASLRTPVILDGVIAGSAALAAKAIAPEVLAACIAGHRSAEPGHQAALAKLGLRPLIDLDLRLGEGTGALLALPLVQSAARAMHDVATFDSAGVTEKA